MSSYDSYLKYLSRTPNELYRDNMLEFINQSFDNTTRLDMIYEESIPFDFIFSNEYSVIVDSVTSLDANTNKISGDYKSFLYQDCNHSNLRGQYVKYNDDYYIIYSPTSRLDTVSKAKALRCNNKIKWNDKKSGKIIEYPVAIGEETSATSKQTSKDGNASNAKLVLIVQGNEDTRSIKINQRFVLSNNTAFTVNGIGMYNMNDYTKESIDFIRLYIEYAPIQETDDLDNNISLGNNEYKINIIQESIVQRSGFSSTLETIVTLNEEVVNPNVEFYSSNPKVVSIDNDGRYVLSGSNGDKAIIYSRIKGLDDCFDAINVQIQNDVISRDEIILDNDISIVNKYDSITFNANLYIDSIKSEDVVRIIPNWVNDKIYKVNETINKNEFVIECFEYSKETLRLTFECGVVTKEIDVIFRGFM